MTVFVHLRLGDFFCFVSPIVFIKEKMQRKEAKESQEALYKKEKIIAGMHNVLEVKDRSRVLRIFSRIECTRLAEEWEKKG